MAEEHHGVNTRDIAARNAFTGNTTFNAPVTFSSTAAIQRSDNLAAAGATRNDRFIGRRAQLDDLAALIDGAGGPSAVVIVAGAGFGKTELAREFINTRALPAGNVAGSSTGTVGAASRGEGGAGRGEGGAGRGEGGAGRGEGGWTARWWLDGSTGGEGASLKLHYETITGRPFPAEPPAPPGTDPAAVAAEFRTRLRHDIATACSTGRQLLVIDNAESPRQIMDYKPANQGRLIATTRRQPIPSAVGRELSLDVMSAADARAVLVSERADLRDAATPPLTPAYTAALDAIALHLGHHALGLAYAAAALARVPLKPPAEVLARLRAADVGEGADLLGEFTEADLGGASRRSLAQSLGLLLDELAEAGSPAHDPLATDLASLAALCDPAAIPVSLLAAASGKEEGGVERSLRALHERSIIILSETARMHRLTQSLVRGRLRRAGGPGLTAAIERLLDALIELCRWPNTVQEELTNHTKDPARMAALPHAEAVLGLVVVPVWAAAGGGGDKNRAASPPWVQSKAARLRSEMASIRQSRGDLAGAEADIQKAIDWEESQSPPNQRELAIRYASRASIRQQGGDLKGAEEDIQKAIDWEESQSPPNQRGLAILYASRASIRQQRGDLKGAEEDIKKSIDWGEAQSPRDERSLAIDYASRASIRRDKGDLAGAEADIKKSIDWGEAQSPRDERSLAIDYASRARIRQHRGDLAGAEADIKKSIDWGKAQTPRDERGLAICYASRASIRRAKGDLAGAEADLKKSIDWGEAQSPRDERSLAIDYASRASIRQQRGDLAGAEEDIQKAINWFEAQTPRDQRGLAFRYETKALILAKAGKFPEAKAAIDESVRLHTACFGVGHEWTKNTIEHQQAIHAGQYPG